MLFKRPKVLVIVRVWDVSQQCETSRTLTFLFQTSQTLGRLKRLFLQERPLKTFSLTENPFSRKTYFYTIRPWRLLLEALRHDAAPAQARGGRMLLVLEGGVLCEVMINNYNL